MKSSTYPQTLLIIGSLLVVIGALIMSIPVFAQDEGFIYGKIYTEDNKVYEGSIRWGKEEIYWTDMFNSSKEKNENLRYLSDTDREKLEERQYKHANFNNHIAYWVGNKSWLGNNDNNFIHQFSCQFGEIKVIRPIGKAYAQLELRNGQKFEVSGEGYNDIGLDIRVADQELGEIEIYWGRIERIEFNNTPPKLDTKFGQPLYGNVQSYGEKFTGYIQWDHDERITTDKLDGNSDDGDLSIEFGKIRSIERRGNQSLVILKSGRELWLDGSNDVSSGHRGVIVMNNDFPSIDIPWNEFEKIVFEEKNPGPIAAYRDFMSQKELSGKVTTHDGKSVSGKIVYDLDETHNYELLQGKEGEFEFTTAFRHVKRITPKGTHRCSVELRNGKKLTLDERQDVNELNQGVLVFSSGKEQPTYIPWDEINEIEFM